MYPFGRIFCHHLRVSQRAPLLLFRSYLATTLLIFIFPSVLRYIHFSRRLPLCITPCFSLLQPSNGYTIRKNCLQLVSWFVGTSSFSSDTKAYRCGASNFLLIIQIFCETMISWNVSPHLVVHILHQSNYIQILQIYFYLKQKVTRINYMKWHLYNNLN